jgi:hypothetical protein
VQGIDKQLPRNVRLNPIHATPKIKPTKIPRELVITLPPELIETLRSPFSGFPRSCAAKARERKRHHSIVFRSHSVQALPQACPRAVWHACPIKM